jgi:tetratricopeptide (TPR) repeat protein
VERLLAEMGRPELLLSRAWLLAMLDRGEEARRDADEAYARLREQSSTRWPDWHLAEISGLAGDHEDASNRLRIVCEWLKETEQLPLLETYLSFLGRSLCRLGRFDEAAQFAERARAIDETIGDGGDSVPDYLWRQVLARVHAHRGDLAEAEKLAREAVAGSEQSDSLDEQCLALCDLAEVLAVAQRLDEAEAALEQALERCRRKKNVARETQVRRRLDSLRHDASLRPGPPA